MQPVWEFPLRLPRHAFSSRDAARAGDVWRCFQEAAVEASTRAGWSPQRYRAANTAFLVRAMTVVHHDEATYGQQTRARTWVSRFRRGMLSTREVRLLCEGEPVVSGTQEWVHVSADLKPKRAPEELTAAFPVHEEDASVTLPSYDEDQGSTFEFAFRPWHTWMDPLAHVNHPAYVDWCDEAVSRRMDAAGLSPVSLQPVAEKATFRSGAEAQDEVVVQTRRVGRTAEGAVALAHRILKGGDVVCADAITVRTLSDGDPGPLWAALG